MSRKLIHILNGDGMAGAFNKSQIPKDEIIIWREGLALGPADPVLLSAENIVRRKLFWDIYSSVEEKLPDYGSFVLPELEKVSQLNNCTVFCWFEYDLFCQINMLYCLSLLNQNEGNHIFLISINDFEGVENFKGFGQLNPEQLEQTFSGNPTLLTNSDLEFAEGMVTLYSNKDPFKIQKVLEIEVPGVFPYLKQSIKAHLERFPSTINGLAQDEQRMLEFVHKEQPSRKGLIRSSLINEHILGFGDLHYFKMIEQLQDYLDFEDEKIKLNQDGIKLLSGKSDFWDKEHEPRWLGGVMISNNHNSIRWDPEKSNLVKLATPDKA